MRDDRRPPVHAVAVHVAGALVVLIGTFMPWIRSGTRRRSSYDLLEVATRLGFSPHGALGWAVRCWPLMPLLLVGSVVAVSIGMHRWAVAVSVVAVLHVGVVAVTVRRAPRSVLIGVESGTWVSLVGAVVMLAGVVLIATRHAARAPIAAAPLDRS